MTNIACPGSKFGGFAPEYVSTRDSKKSLEQKERTPEKGSRFIVRLKGEVPKLVMSGYLCAEGLLGAEDGAAHVCFFDGVSVEDEV